MQLQVNTVHSLKLNNPYVTYRNLCLNLFKNVFVDTPGPCGAVNVKDYTKESVVITWDVPTVDGGAPINNYIIEKREASMKSYKTVTTECKKTLYRITGLEEGTQYVFRVLPENIYGIGEPCDITDPVLVCEVPYVPQDLYVIDIAKSTVILGWEKPFHDGGSRLSGYVIEACKTGSDRWMNVAYVKSSLLQHTIVSLNENEQYLFRIRAENSRGVSEPRDLMTPVTIQEQRGNKSFKLINDMRKAVINYCFILFIVSFKL